MSKFTGDFTTTWTEMIEILESTRAKSVNPKDFVTRCHHLFVFAGHERPPWDTADGSRGWRPTHWVDCRASVWHVYQHWGKPWFLIVQFRAAGGFFLPNQQLYIESIHTTRCPRFTHLWLRKIPSLWFFPQWINFSIPTAHRPPVKTPRSWREITILLLVKHVTDIPEFCSLNRHQYH